MSVRLNKKRKTYRKLAGLSVHFLVAYGLWQGKHHLLLSTHHLFSESYIRIYFSDIQVIFVRKSNRSRFVTITSLSLSLFFFMIALMSPPQFSYFFIFMLATLFMIILRNIIMGPSCEFHIKTAVQMAKVPAVNRKKKAVWIISLLTPIVLKHQQWIGNDPQYKNHPSIHRHIFEKAEHKGDPHGKESGIFHFLLFSLLLLKGIYLIISLFIHHPFMNIGWLILFLSILIFSIISMARQAGIPFSFSLKTATTVTFVSAVFEWICLCTSFFSLKVKNILMNQTPETILSFTSDPAQSKLSFFNFLMDISPKTNAFSFNLILVFGIICSLIGISGLLFLKAYLSETAGELSSDEKPQAL